MNNETTSPGNLVAGTAYAASEQEKKRSELASVDAETQKAPASVMQSALNEQGEQLDKTHGLLETLYQRLNPVLDSRTLENSTESDLNPPRGGSPLVQQVEGNTQSVRNLQAKINALLATLEV